MSCGYSRVDLCHTYTYTWHIICRRCNTSREPCLSPKGLPLYCSHSTQVWFIWLQGRTDESVSEVTLVIFSLWQGSKDDQELEHLSWRGCRTGAGTAWGKAASGRADSSPPAPTGRLSMWRAKLFLAVHGGRMRYEGFRLGIGKDFFITTTARQLIRLNREAAQALFLEVFNKQLDKAMSNLVWPQTWPWLEQELGLETSRFPFQLGLYFCSVINCRVSSLSSVVLSPFHRDLEEKLHSLIKWEV